MKTKLILAFVVLIAAVTFAAPGMQAQCPSQTPNVGFQIPNVGNTTTWGLCLNGDLTTLDNLLGGSATFPVGTATAAIDQYSNWVTANISPQTVTNITGGFAGQTINIFCGVSDTFTSIAGSATISVSGTFSCSTGSSITLTFLGTVWREVSRRVTAVPGTVTSVSCGNMVNLFTCAVATATSTPALSFTPITTGAVLDCSTFAGADFGAKLVACIAGLPAAGGIADATKFSSPQTMTTAVNMNKPGVIKVCGIAVSQAPTLTISANNASIVSCPESPAVFTQTSTNPQVVVTGNNSGSSGVQYVGNASSGTDVMVLEGDGSVAMNNKITNFGVNGINIDATSLPLNATPMTISGNTIISATTSTGSDIKGTMGTGSVLIQIFQNNLFVQSTNSFCIDALILEAFLTNNKCQFLADSAGGINIGGGILTANFIATADDMGDLWTTTNPILQVSGGDSIVGNSFLGSGDPMAGFDGQSCVLAMGSLPGGADSGTAAAIMVDISDNVFVNCGGPANSAAIEISDRLSMGTEDFSEVTITGNTIRTGASDGTHDMYGILINITNAMSIAGDINITGNNLRDFNPDDPGDAHEIAIAILNPNNVGITSFDVNDNTIYNFNRGILDTNIGAATFKNNRFDNTTTPYAGTFSATEHIIDATTPFTAATLPTIADGSLLLCSDCATGTSAVATHQGGHWTWTPYGLDTHTAEITGNYGPVTLIPSTAPTGSYLVTIYVEVSTSVATSTITTSIGYNDDTGAQTQTGVVFSAATSGTIQSLTFPVRFVTGTALTYSTSTANSPKYKIFARTLIQ